MGDWLNALRRLEEERSPPQQQALVPILIPQPNPAAMATNPTRRHAVAIHLEDLRHDLNLIAQLIVCHTARGDSLAKEIEVAEAIVAELKDKHQQSVAESNRLDQVGTLNIMKQRLLHQELCVDFKQYQVRVQPRSRVARQWAPITCATICLVPHTPSVRTHTRPYAPATQRACVRTGQVRQHTRNAHSCPASAHPSTHPVVHLSFHS